MAMLPPGVRHQMIPGAHQPIRNFNAEFSGVATDGSSVGQAMLRQQQAANRFELNQAGGIPQSMTALKEAGLSAASAQNTAMHAQAQAASFQAAEGLQASNYDPRRELALQVAQRHKSNINGLETKYLAELGHLASA